MKNVCIDEVSVLNRLNLEKMEGLSLPRDEANCQVMLKLTLKANKGLLPKT